MGARGYTLIPMHDSEPRSKLREVRERVGVSARELARAADIGLSTLLGAEHGRLPTQATRDRITRALTDALHERHADAIAETRASVARAESELASAEARVASARQRLDDVEQQHDSDVALLEAGLWDEPDDPVTDGESSRIAA